MQTDLHKVANEYNGKRFYNCRINKIEPAKLYESLFPEFLLKYNLPIIAMVIGLFLLRI